MELFIQNLPTNQQQHLLERQIRRSVKSVFGKKVEVDLNVFRKNPANASLTFPDYELGLRFLLYYQKTGLTLRDRTGDHRTIRIQRSRNKVNMRLVEGLRARQDSANSDSSDVDDTVVRTSTPKGRGVSSSSVSFEKICWGIWLSGGTFGHCGTLNCNGKLAYNPQAGELEAQWISDLKGREAGIVIDNIIIREVLLDRRTTPHRLYFTLDRIPRFWSHNNLAHRIDHHDLKESDPFGMVDLIPLFVHDFEIPKHRLPALSPQHANSAPYCTVYAVEGSTISSDVSQLLKSMKRSDPTKVQVQTVSVDLPEMLSQLEELYRRYDYSISFQLDLLVRNCYLSPSEVVSLSQDIDILLTDFGIDKTVQVLQAFSCRLPVRTFQTVSAYDDLLRMISETANVCNKCSPQLSPGFACIHRLDIMPAGYNLEGPVTMGNNRVLRLFPENHDRFLKVTFSEEDLTKIHQNREYDLSPILQDRWFAILSKGINLAGRHFQFLGFAQSSLKEHSTWLISPFEHHGRYITPAVLHSDLGDFHKIRCPPRLAARLGQTFTSTSHSLEIEPEFEVSTVADIERNGHVFSDGVGRISEGMMKRIWEVTGVSNDKVKPVVYQIRLGGSKGVLSLDTTLQSDRICLRRSMTKFAAENKFLELANKGKILPFFLNRQVIVVLESLGVHPDAFLKILQADLFQLKSAVEDIDEMEKLCRRYGLAQGTNLSHILETLRQNGVSDILRLPFFHELNSLALDHALKQIKYKSRIHVSSSWKLIGILDEFDYLKEGEVYVCLRNEVEDTIQHLQGDAIVTRSPTLHCGDIQIVKAVGEVDPRHPLSAIHNCIVFSSRGSRPIPNMLAGGDLDGDLYDISVNSLLFPPSLVDPDSYPHTPPAELDRDCTTDDIIDFFVKFIINDNLGQLCTRHAIFADQSPIGARSEQCVTLSRLVSTAVDFPKTGVPVNMQEAPWVTSRVKPDFMAPYPLTEEEYAQNLGNGRYRKIYYYKSGKVLGQIYRRIDNKNLLEIWNAGIKLSTFASDGLWESIEGNLRTLVPLYERLWDDFVKEATDVFGIYVERLTDIQRRFHPMPWREQQLTEAEVFMQCIKSDPMLKIVWGRGKADYLPRLRSEYRELVERVKSEIWATPEGRFQRAAAYFYVGIHESAKRESNHGESFAWVVVADVFAAWKQVEQNGYVDGEHL
jgi:hypothetical protein